MLLFYVSSYSRSFLREGERYVLTLKICWASDRPGKTKADIIHAGGCQGPLVIVRYLGGEYYRATPFALPILPTKPHVGETEASNHLRNPKS